MLVPPYLKKTKSVDALLPWLCLKGFSSQDFREALVAILGPSANALSRSTIALAKEGWEDELKQWASSSLAAKRYVYWWVDGLYFNVRGEDARSCILIIIGLTETGRKELVAIDEGSREASDCLSKDREVLLAFYDFPAAQWQHIRTTNPIESTFATVRLRRAKTRGCVSRTTILTMVFKLGMSTLRRWRRMKGFEQLAKVVTGVKVRDGVEDVPVQKSKKMAKGQAA